MISLARVASELLTTAKLLTGEVEAKAPEMSRTAIKEEAVAAPSEKDAALFRKAKEDDAKVNSTVLRNAGPDTSPAVTKTEKKAEPDTSVKPTTREELEAHIQDLKFGQYKPAEYSNGSRAGTLNPERINKSFGRSVNLLVAETSDFNGLEGGIKELIEKGTKGQTPKEALERLAIIEQAFSRDAGYDIDAARKVRQTTSPYIVKECNRLAAESYKESKDPDKVAGVYYDALAKNLGIEEWLTRELERGNRRAIFGIKDLMRSGLAELGKDIAPVGAVGKGLNQRLAAFFESHGVK